MTGRLRHLAGRVIPSPPPPPPPSTEATLDSDFVVILAALLCALICVLGLVAVARCAWIRRISGRDPPTDRPAAIARRSANKGLKKKVLKSLPKLTYGEDEKHAERLSECAICLAEFSAGEEVRVLPQCGHGFHVICIDTWLGSHSSCPSCRQILVVAAPARCQKCGNLPSAGDGGGTQPQVNEIHVNRKPKQKSVGWKCSQYKLEECGDLESFTHPSWQQIKCS